jgi:hypothetical protein
MEKPGKVAGSRYSESTAPACMCGNYHQPCDHSLLFTTPLTDADVGKDISKP